MTDNITQKAFRVRPKAYEIYKFIEYDFIRKFGSRDSFDKIISFSLKYVKINTLDFAVSRYIPRRLVKGFSLQNSTLNNLISFHNKNSHLLLAEIIEIFIYIYAINNLSDDEIKMLDIDYIEQGFTKIYR